MAGITLTTSQAAYEFRKSRDWVMRRIGDAKLMPCEKVGARDMYTLRELVPVLTEISDTDAFQRKANLQSEQIALKLAIERAEVLHIDDARLIFASIVKTVRNFVEILPDELERDSGYTPAQITALEKRLDAGRVALHKQILDAAEKLRMAPP